MNMEIGEGAANIVCEAPVMEFMVAREVVVMFA